MAPETSNDGSPPSPNPGLPPVQPPSGRFIIQLFVVPGLIIAVVVLIVLLLNYAARSGRDPSFFLQQLDSDNADIRWRGASDLAQILKRTEPATLRWKSDPKFALDLTERLQKSFQRLIDEEKKLAAEAAKAPDENKKLVWRKLNKERDLLTFLAGALGEFHVPVGAPVLCEILKHKESPDQIGNTQQRRKAMVALMNMGANRDGFAKLPTEVRDGLLIALKEEASSGENSARTNWARAGLFYLDKSTLPSGHAMGDSVDDTLAICAADPDQFLRKLTAMSFTFWWGDKAEATLIRLTKDQGWGTLLKDEDRD